MENKRKEISFEVIEHVGVIAKYQNGWQKEINVVSWNDGPAKYDIRDWDPDHEHMSRGITLSEDDMQSLRELMDGREKAAIAKFTEKKSKGWER
jgi:hypothetical protein